MYIKCLRKIVINLACIALLTVPLTIVGALKDTDHNKRLKPTTLTVASKSFTESVILAELLRQLAVDSGSVYQRC